jgi:hypothetical protein
LLLLLLLLDTMLHSSRTIDGTISTVVFPAEIDRELPLN